MVAAPVALVVDIVALPVSAYSDTPALGRTEKMLDAAGEAITEAVKPDRG